MLIILIFCRQVPILHKLTSHSGGYGPPVPLHCDHLVGTKRRWFFPTSQSCRISSRTNGFFSWILLSTGLSDFIKKEGRHERGNITCGLLKNRFVYRTNNGLTITTGYLPVSGMKANSMCRYIWWSGVISGGW